MSQQNRGRDTSSAQGPIADVSSSGELHVVEYSPDIGSTGGRFWAQTMSGALTAIAAKTSSAGHLWSFQNATATSTKLCLIHRVKLAFFPTVAATGAQQVGFALWKTTAHTVQPTSGAAVSAATPQLKQRTSLPAPEAAIYYANGTAALTAGTYTIDTQAVWDERDWNLASGAAVPFPVVKFELNFERRPIVRAQNEGLLITNSVLMANSLAGNLAVAVEWSEVPSYPQ